MNVVVTSPSFSRNKNLQDEIFKYFPKAKLNIKGKIFNQQELIEYLKDADAAIVGLEIINEVVLNQCKKLKIIAKYGVGLDNINLQDCRKRNIAIGWTGGVNKLSVAEMTLGFMLMFSRNLYITSNELKLGKWNKSGGFQLSEKKIGIIGLGFIGKELVRLIKPFKCEIFINDIVNKEKYCRKNNLKETSKEQIYKNSDIVTIHVPYNQTTNKMVDIEVLKNMKKSSYIINTSRGNIINEQDLKYALQNNIISGAAIDVYREEPPTDQDFLKLPNLICTPHIGGNAKEAIEAMGISAIKHLKQYYNL